jgi:hypothetical protein
MLQHHVSKTNFVWLSVAKKSLLLRLRMGEQLENPKV